MAYKLSVIHKNKGIAVKMEIGKIDIISIYTKAN